MAEFKLDLGFATLVVAENIVCLPIKEVMIYLEDKENRVVQDIAIVRQKYHYDETVEDTVEEIVNEDKVEVLVFGDRNDEDYTRKIIIRPLLKLELDALKKGDGILVLKPNGERLKVQYESYDSNRFEEPETVWYKENGELKSIPASSFLGKYH